jgi:hypothetical protein
MPQPIDMQSELGRTLAAERMLDAAARAALLAQQRAQVDAERQRAALEHEVSQTHEPESEGVDSQGRRQGDTGRRTRGEEKGQPEEPARPSRAAGEDHALDVSV